MFFSNPPHQHQPFAHESIIFVLCLWVTSPPSDGFNSPRNLGEKLGPSHPPLDGSHGFRNWGCRLYERDPENAEKKSGYPKVDGLWGKAENQMDDLGVPDFEKPPNTESIESMDFQAWRLLRWSYGSAWSADLGRRLDTCSVAFLVFQSHPKSSKVQKIWI